MYNLKIDSLSFATEVEAAAALRTAFLAAGGNIGGATSTVAAAATDFMVDCAGNPPMFFQGWTYRAGVRPEGDQLPNLFKGVIDIREVTGVQAPSQLNGSTRLDKIQRELVKYEFMGAHCAEWYAKPENVAFFPEEWKTGYTVFLEKYRDSVVASGSCASTGSAGGCTSAAAMPSAAAGSARRIASQFAS